MVTAIISVLVLVVGLWVLNVKIRQRRLRLPPGPFPLPLVGNLITLLRAKGDTPYEKLFYLSKTYGNIFTIRIGSTNTIILNGIEPMKSILKSGDYENRFNFDWILDSNFGTQLGLFLSDYNIWKESRSVTMKLLRDFGLRNVNSMDIIIQYEFTEFVSWFKSRVGAEGIILVDDIFNGSMVNILWSIVTGVRFDLDDPDFHKFLEAVGPNLRLSEYSQTSWLGPIKNPFLMFYIPKWIFKGRSNGQCYKLFKLCERTVKDYREKGTYKDVQNNFVDVFLREIDIKNPEGGAVLNDLVYTDKNLACILCDLFMGGSDTTANAMAYMVRLMVQYPKVQSKVQDEIDTVIGKQVVSLEDKRRLPYTMATILEILRFTNVAPFIYRRAIKDSNCGPYKIPKDTFIIGSLHSVQMDENVWGDPHNFRPERFLNEKMEIVHSQKLLVFSIGKRNCIGELTTKESLFIGTVSVLQHFLFEADPKSEIPGNEIIFGISTSPVPFSVKVSTRI